MSTPPPPPPSPSSSAATRLIGIGAALLTVLIWAGWIVATRHSVSTNLGPIDIGLLRYGVPALLLLPAWGRLGPLPRRLPAGLLAVMVIGSGAPFLLLGAMGMSLAPAGHAGALMPGTMPLWAGLIGITLMGERPGRLRLGGLVLIGLGALVLAFPVVAGGNGGLGEGVLLGAGALWAAYTHAFRRSGLSAPQAAGLVAVWSLALHLGLAAVAGTALLHLPLVDLLTQTLIQGVLSGFIAILCYGVAVRRLGATPAAAFSALVPVLAILGGWAFLGEAPTPSDLAGGTITGLGVLLATGIGPPLAARARPKA
ncbi:hypothetical protein F11_15735 [Rhodospirillum rubrum F11]|uniref:EamA domain-containing protein n=1 Tax=Rhodospirillum rubrum (strain ATCC 11170 / ATH 1.1.1 / DSM 467 / LMG 4362 / NCIMB 8255 / S1) TaxID=269796 RepID=Q2RPS9_RHORT|nr:DMT family transporter [Rhodospirillum rubrum]ABC23866.1 Protein of unknown function DUF6, transmembrane [Rhodospirillum rubrum ATCC 11170]AEO49609.1 hypothetical protein F11_15735 [Rhodospirillum rubrum F11]QXG79812.1 DMT family transporter [Rhodospirillum rubrum]